MSVVDLNGKKLAEAASATSLSIENVPTGIYIVTVECNGKVSAMKVRK
ncbi:T9SS type A sorting domain-containing protein [Prevotella sp.]